MKTLAHRFNLIIALLAAAVGALLPYLYATYQINLNDEFYQALCVRHYQMAPLAPLTYYVGYIWTSIFGQGIYTLRVLALLLYEMAIAAGVIYACRRGLSRCSGMYIFGILCLCINLMHYYGIGLNIYNWDTGCYLPVTLAMLTLIAYIRKPNLSLSIIGGIITACAICSRVTCIAVWPIYIIIILISCKVSRHIVKHLAVYSATLITICLLIITLIFGSVNSYFQTLQHGVISGHGVVTVILDSLNCLPAVAPFWLPGLILLPFSFAKSSKWWLTGVVISLITFAILYKLLSGGVGIMQMPFIILTTWCIFKSSGRERFIPITILIFSLIPGLGSDAYPFRLFFLPMVPLLYITIIKCSMTVAYKYMLMSATVIIAIAIAFGTITTYQIFKSTHVSLHRMEHIVDTPSNIQMLKNMSLHDNGHKSVAIGMHKYIHDYLYTDTPGYNLHLFHYAGLSHAEIEQDASKVAAETDKIILSPMQGYSADNQMSEYIQRLHNKGFDIVSNHDGVIIMERDTTKHASSLLDKKK